MRVLLIASLALLVGCSGGIEVRTRDEFIRAVQAAKPGDRILVAPGRYEGNIYFDRVNGTPERLIVVAAKDPRNPPVFQGGRISAIKFSHSSYFLLENLIAEHAADVNFHFGWSHHFILRNCVSRDIAGTGNNDGMKLDGCRDFLLYGCTVTRWGGEGSAIDIVGGSHALLARCFFAYPDLTGQTANGIQPKGGAFNMGFYRNRFDHASLRAQQFGGSTGGTREYEGRDQVAMGNVILGGEAPVAFVSCIDCRFEYNTIVNPERYIVRILKEGGTRPTARNTFAHNLIVYGKIDEYINIGDSKGRVDVASHLFHDNYWYNTTDPAASIPALPVHQSSESGGQDPGPLGGPRAKAVSGLAAAHGARAAEMEKAWAAHTDKFPWAWRWAQKFESER